MGYTARDCGSKSGNPNGPEITLSSHFFQARYECLSNPNFSPPGIQHLSIPYNRLSTIGFQAIVEIVNARVNMLWTLFVILLVLWLLGVVSSYTMGGFIHLLLVLAVIALVFQLITGRRAAV
jgi:hypothetical protein